VNKQQATLNAKLRGHYRYYGRPTNYRSLRKFQRSVQRTWKKWLVASVGQFELIGKDLLTIR